MKYLHNPFLLILLFIAAMLLIFGAGCTNTPATAPAKPATPAAATGSPTKIQADLKAGLTELNKVKDGAITDVESAAGQKLLADVGSTALNVGVDALGGNDTGAVLAGLEGAGSALNDYSGLPTTTSSVVKDAVAIGSGVDTVATKVAPAISTLYSAAVAKGASTYSVLQAIVKAFYAVRGSTTAPTTLGTPAHTSAVLVWITQPFHRHDR